MLFSRLETHFLVEKLIEKDVLPHVSQRLLRPTLPPIGCEVRPTFFVGVPFL